MQARQGVEVALQVGSHDDRSPAKFSGDNPSGFNVIVECGARDACDGENLLNRQGLH